MQYGMDGDVGVLLKLEPQRLYPVQVISMDSPLNVSSI